MDVNTYRLQASQLQESYVEGLQLLRQAHYKTQKDWLVEGLKMDYKEAQELLDNHQGDMHETTIGQLQLILSRPPNEFASWRAPT